MKGANLYSYRRETMRSVRRLMLLILLVGAMTTGTVAAVGPGMPAPEFTLSSTGGDTISISDYLGRIVILHFWKSN